MPSATALPVEVIDKILYYFCGDASYKPTDDYNSAKASFLNQKTVKDLLSLQLLGHNWAAAVQHIVYRSLYLTIPWGNQLLDKISSGNMFFSGIPRLRQLTLNHVMYKGDVGPGSFYERIKDENMRKLELEQQRKGIKVLELMPTGNNEDSKRVVIARRNSLRVLFTDTLPCYLPQSLHMTRFPKLRIVRNLYLDGLVRHPDWFEWPMFQTVEIFITRYRRGYAYWQEDLDKIMKRPMPPNLKHFVFLIHQNTLHVELITAGFSYGAREPEEKHSKKGERYDRLRAYPTQQPENKMPV
ncbi:uncharacterized protein MELLADRAFT_113880 [Melampsora larici-populina 98AG31]|uniref:Uncharacterized protein n=1 Tax=Melampsora larici-populina (strain 98AG31 / pathotype 3-4-7) TaxID=747676 RepID=F4SBC3_MELLP|nr:uncharacterized protein MELLADRAFT_113880 [Melampsora larici-populina 98AG31]EGF98038.1 hypothetical protein MELLADRAFT_113880 [Melampsora larici-populina 98AG31]